MKIKFKEGNDIDEEIKTETLEFFERLFELVKINEFLDMHNLEGEVQIGNLY